jgi:hypothetical protein
MTTVEEGLAMFRLGLLPSEAIHDLASLFLSEGCDVLEMAALASSLPAPHPADLRADFERALVLVGRPLPDRVTAARTLKRIYAQRGVSGAWSPRSAAAAIKDIFQSVEAELPQSGIYLGESFGISTLIGLYYSYDDIRFDDAHAAHDIDVELRAELGRIAVE